MRVLLFAILLANLAAACSHVQAETGRPFTGNVPRIPGNYAAGARLPKSPVRLPYIAVNSTPEHPDAPSDYQYCVERANWHESNNVAGVEACNSAFTYAR